MKKVFNCNNKDIWRCPEERELRDLVHYLRASGYGTEYTDIKEVHAIIMENYKPIGEKYEQKAMFVLYQLPHQYELYIWKRGEITRVQCSLIEEMKIH